MALFLIESHIKMKIIYALEPLEKSIFLAGPTPRSDDVPSWRPKAIELLNWFGYEGTVIVPETSDGQWKHNYDDQVYWEWAGLNQASVILFWIPRTIDDMPAFTTNVEFGMFAASSKVVYGRPNDTPKMKYLDSLAERYNIPIYTTLESAVIAAINF